MHSQVVINIKINFNFLIVRQYLIQVSVTFQPPVYSKENLILSVIIPGQSVT